MFNSAKEFVSGPGYVSRPLLGYECYYPKLEIIRQTSDDGEYTLLLILRSEYQSMIDWFDREKIQYRHGKIGYNQLIHYKSVYVENKHLPFIKLKWV